MVIYFCILPLSLCFGKQVANKKNTLLMVSIRVLLNFYTNYYWCGHVGA